MSVKLTLDTIKAVVSKILEPNQKIPSLKSQRLFYDRTFLKCPIPKINCYSVDNCACNGLFQQAQHSVG